MAVVPALAVAVLAVLAVVAPVAVSHTVDGRHSLGLRMMAVWKATCSCCALLFGLPCALRTAEAGGGGLLQAPPSSSSVLTLRDAAAGTGVFIGAAVNYGYLSGDTDPLLPPADVANYSAIVSSEFSIITAENAMKMKRTEPVARGESDPI